MACSVYESAITQLTQELAAGEAGSSSSSSSKAQELVFLALQYAQLLSQVGICLMARQAGAQHAPAAHGDCTLQCNAVRADLDWGNLPASSC
jgi:hypothetical protein